MPEPWTWETTFDWYDGPLCGIVSLNGKRYYAWVLGRYAQMHDALALWPVEAFDHVLTEDELAELLKKSCPRI